MVLVGLVERSLKGFGIHEFLPEGQS
jgi:hypothetical protein